MGRWPVPPHPKRRHPDGTAAHALQERWIHKRDANATRVMREELRFSVTYGAGIRVSALRDNAKGMQFCCVRYGVTGVSCVLGYPSRRSAGVTEESSAPYRALVRN